MESLAYQVSDIIELMELDTDIVIDILYVDGGAAQNNLLVQFQADILENDLRRPSSNSWIRVRLPCWFSSWLLA